MLGFHSLVIAGRQDHTFLLYVVFKLEVVGSFSFGLDKFNLGPAGVKHISCTVFLQLDWVVSEY